MAMTRTLTTDVSLSGNHLTFEVDIPIVGDT